MLMRYFEAPSISDPKGHKVFGFEDIGDEVWPVVLPDGTRVMGYTSRIMVDGTERLSQVTHEEANGDVLRARMTKDLAVLSSLDIDASDWDRVKLIVVREVA